MSGLQGLPHQYQQILLLLFLSRWQWQSVAFQVRIKQVWASQNVDCRACTFCLRNPQRLRPVSKTPQKKCTCQLFFFPSAQTDGSPASNMSLFKTLVFSYFSWTFQYGLSYIDAFSISGGTTRSLSLACNSTSESLACKILLKLRYTSIISDVPSSVV